MAFGKNVVSGRFVVGTVAAALLLTAAAITFSSGADSFGAAAWAQEAGKGQGGQGDNGNQGEGQGNQGQGKGQGGPGEDSDGKGPQAGNAGASGGGKPIWAQEGIPEVELGRLNVARSPDQVLDRSLTEALKTLTPEMVSYYNLTLDQAVEALSLNFDTTVFVDSPLQNLALLKDMLDGTSALTASGVVNDTATLAAMMLGAASDKTVPISVDTVIAVTAILGTPVTGDAAAQLAADAEAIRIAILAGHG